MGALIVSSSRSSLARVEAHDRQLPPDEALYGISPVTETRKAPMPCYVAEPYHNFILQKQNKKINSAAKKQPAGCFFIAKI